MPAISVIPPDARKIKSLEDVQIEKRLRAVANDPAVKNFKKDLNIHERLTNHFETLEKPLNDIRDTEIRKADLGNDSEGSCSCHSEDHEVEFDKDVDITLLLKSRAIIDGDIDQY